MCAGYLLNRYFTFHHIERGRVLWDELIRFFSVHALGGLLNFGVFSLIVTVAEGRIEDRVTAQLIPLLGVWIGGLVGMTFNFLMSRKHVFGRDKDPG
jgi:putative flippase GtrA